MGREYEEYTRMTRTEVKRTAVFLRNYTRYSIYKWSTYFVI